MSVSAEGAQGVESSRNRGGEAQRRRSWRGARADQSAYKTVPRFAVDRRGKGLCGRSAGEETGWKLCGLRRPRQAGRSPEAAILDSRNRTIARRRTETPALEPNPCFDPPRRYRSPVPETLNAGATAAAPAGLGTASGTCGEAGRGQSRGQGLNPCSKSPFAERFVLDVGQQEAAANEHDRLGGREAEQC
jgi:hypothetical protein